jgi:hypothetical protein
MKTDSEAAEAIVALNGTNLNGKNIAGEPSPTTTASYREIKSSGTIRDRPKSERLSNGTIVRSALPEMARHTVGQVIGSPSPLFR